MRPTQRNGQYIPKTIPQNQQYYQPPAQYYTPTYNPQPEGSSESHQNYQLPAQYYTVTYTPQTDVCYENQQNYQQPAQYYSARYSSQPLYCYNQIDQIPMYSPTQHQPAEEIQQRQNDRYNDLNNESGQNPNRSDDHAKPNQANDRSVPPPFQQKA